MQGESYFLQRPHYAGVYEPGWNNKPGGYNCQEGRLFEDIISVSSNHVISPELIDDVTTADAAFPRFDVPGSSMHDFKFPPINHPEDACFMPPYQGSIYDPHLSAYQVGPQPPYPEYPNQSIDRFLSMEHPGYRPDDPSDSDSGVHSPQSNTSLTGDMRSWPVKAEKFDVQSYLTTCEYSHRTLSETPVPQPHPPICDYDTHIFNMDDHLHYPLDTFAPNEPYIMEPSKYMLCPDPIKSEPVDGESWSVPPAPHQLIRPGNHLLPSIPEPSKTKIHKKTQRKKRRKGNDREKCVHLWEFIRDILLEPQCCPSLMKWEDRRTGVFRFVKSDTVASMWGKKKQNPKMTYEKLSRAMRYYYNRGILERVDGRRLVYKFGPNAHGWKSCEAATVQRDNDVCNTSQDVDASDTSSVRNYAAPCLHKNNKASNDVIDTASMLLPSADVLLGKPNSHSKV